MIFRIFNQYIPMRRLVLAGLESMFLLAILIVCQWTIAEETGAPSAIVSDLFPNDFMIILIVQVSLYYYELYDFRVFRSSLEMLIRLLQSLGYAVILLAGIYFFLPDLMIGKGVFLFSLIFISIGVICWRLLYNEYLKMQYIDQKVLILGTGPLAKRIAEEILEDADTGFKVVGFTAKESSRIGERLVNPSIIGTHDMVLQLAKNERIQRIVIANEDRREGLPLGMLMECKTRGIKIEEGIEFYERLTGKIEIKHLHPSFIIFSDGFKNSRLTRRIKRMGDFLLSLSGIAILSPAILLISLLIKMDSPGPVFYRQERIGRGGRGFELMKFRSMRNDAESAGPVWAKENDSRVTRVGKWLRKSRLDEVPQMINVIRGEMSFVGPRPERGHFVSQLRTLIPYYDQRFSVLPGITGWAQVKYRYGASFEDAAEKLKYDLYYIKNMSIAFDLFIIFETLKIVLFGKGAR